MWSIDKKFDFCYGHRVWSQTLNKEYSLDGCLKCRHQHGHQGEIKVFLSSKGLEGGMVTDFKHLNWFKQWLDDTLDHKFIMDINDPLREHIYPITKHNISSGEEFDKLFKYHEGEYYTIWGDLYQNLDLCLKEMYEGLVFVSFVPTSENLSKWIFDIINNKMNKIGVECTKIEFNETPKSRSTYSK